MTCQHETTPQAISEPICTACAYGYHDEVVIIQEGCACPCHGPLNVEMGVAA